MTLENSTITTAPYIPPVNTAPPPNPIVDNIVGAIILSVIFFIVIIIIMRRNRKSNKDIDPELKDLMSDPYSQTSGMIVMFVLIMVPMYGSFGGLSLIMQGATAYGGLLILGSVFTTIIPYQFFKQQERDRTRNMKKMEGTLYTKAGKKMKYRFGEVDFDSERRISTASREAILATKGMTKKILDRLHPIPARVNGEYEVYFLFEGPFADAIAWMNDEQLDNYGSYKTKADSPVLKEICKIQRVQINPDDENDLVNEYTFVFWVMFDDSHAARRQAGLELVDLTDNEMFAGLTKTIGADRKVLAGAVNATTEELAGYKNDDRSFEAKANNRANGIADGLIADKEALSMLDKIGTFNIQYWLTIIVVFVFGTIFGAGVIQP